MKQEQTFKQNERYRDKFRGCLLGGAAGDALGYPIEFLREKEILQRYGANGICAYHLSSEQKAWISDDTQMTLFTATGLLFGKTSRITRGAAGELYTYSGLAYQTWYRMQIGQSPRDASENSYSWLADVPEMGKRRAPGFTCMSVICSGTYGTTEHPINHSKGCGGIMRAAPAGLYFNRPTLQRETIDDVWKQATGIAALTHGHELGWLPAGVLAHIVNRLTYSSMTPTEAVREAQAYLLEHYGKQKHTKMLSNCLDQALSLTKNQKSDSENIQLLGEGWIAEETLAIAVYCSVKYAEDFSKALCVAVNHSGDSDSTGAVTGNILGALWGYTNIPAQWKEHLECAEVILKVADDLWHDCQLGESGASLDPEWERNYVQNRR